MRFLTEIDLWTLTPPHLVVIPTNLDLMDRGQRAVMGAGLALAARQRFPGLDLRYGAWIKGTPHGGRTEALCVFPEDRLILLPTKRHWKEQARMPLVEEGLRALAQFEFPWESDEQRIVVPRIGCGLGNLSWAMHVRPKIVEILGASPLEHRFMIIE